MTAADRVVLVASQLDQWRTIPEIALRLHCRSNLVRWSIRQLATRHVIFVQQRSPRTKIYRVFPEARDVHVVQKEDFARNGKLVNPPIDPATAPTVRVHAEGR